MGRYPKARWSVSEGSVGASVWTRQIPEGSGGGYYLYEWARGDLSITVQELVEGTTMLERQWPVSKRSSYAELRRIEVPAEVLDADARAQEEAVARLIFADMQKRFEEIQEWITYGSDGQPIWFHETVTGPGEG